MAKAKKQEEQIDLVKLHALPKALKDVTAVSVQKDMTITKKCPKGDEGK